MFGEKLREARKRAGMTLGQLARQLDISVSHLSNVELGIKRPLPVDVVRKAAAILHTDEQDLLAAAFREPMAFTLNAKSQMAQETAAGLARQWDSMSERQHQSLQRFLENLEDE